MKKVVISEGKTTNEAIEKGLEELKTTKEKVDIKVIETEKRMFFSILTPRVVKVEITLKEEYKDKTITIELTEEEQEIAKQNISVFLETIIKNFQGETKYEIEKTSTSINVNIFNQNIGFLIGYRGETLYALQDILTAISGKNIEKRVRVLLDIENYKEKRIKTLEELAQKVSKTVMKTKKEIKLEPMKPYERKIIHSKLQENNKIETKSIGEEPNRRIIISIKR